MAIEVGSIGGVGQFKPESFNHGELLASGQTGVLKVLGTAGKITVLKNLYTAGTNAQVGISIIVDGVEILPPQPLSDQTPAASSGFFVSQGVTNSSIDRATNYIKEIVGEFITIKKDAGNTTNDILLSSELGVFV